MSPTASLPEETALCLSVTHPASLDSWTHVTTPRLYFEDQCLPALSPLPPPQRASIRFPLILCNERKLTGSFVSILSLPSCVFFKIVLLILREFHTMYFDHIYPPPSSSSLPLSLNFKVFSCQPPELRYRQAQVLVNILNTYNSNCV